MNECLRENHSKLGDLLSLIVRPTEFGNFGNYFEMDYESFFTLLDSV